MVPQQTAFPGSVLSLGRTDFFLVMAASVLIAAGGYVINDYFDLNIDKINRPDSLVIEKVIKRRWAMVWHLIFSIGGLLLSFHISMRISNILPALFNSLVVLMLWMYSTTFKRQLLIGNIIISLLTAWVVLVLYVCEAGMRFVRADRNQLGLIVSIYKMAILYGGFAFMSSLIREVVKDMEDMHGDARYACRTMPIVWGIRASKIFTSVWLVVLFFSVFALAAYSFIIQRWIFGAYLAIGVMFPLLVSLFRLRVASDISDYAHLSRLVKFVMLSGILSMGLFLLDVM
jgi:4-hydroxybenzoate polyprenyltransferase